MLPLRRPQIVYEERTKKGKVPKQTSSTISVDDILSVKDNSIEVTEIYQQKE